MNVDIFPSYMPASLLLSILYMDNEEQIFSIANGGNSPLNSKQQQSLTKIFHFPGFRSYFRHYFDKTSDFGPTLYQLCPGETQASVLSFSKALRGNGDYLLDVGRKPFLGFDESGFPYFGDEIENARAYRTTSEALDRFNRVNPLDATLSTLCSLWNNVYSAEHPDYHDPIQAAFADTQKLRRRFRIPLGILLGYQSTYDYKVFSVEPEHGVRNPEKTDDLIELFKHLNTYLPLLYPSLYQRGKARARELGPLRLRKESNETADGLYVTRKPLTHGSTTLDFSLHKVVYKGDIHKTPEIIESKAIKRNLSLDQIIFEFPAIDSMALLVPTLLHIKFGMLGDIDHQITTNYKGVEQIIDEAFRENPGCTLYALRSLAAEQGIEDIDPTRLDDLKNAVIGKIRPAEIQAELSQTLTLVHQASLLHDELRELKGLKSLSNLDEIARTTQQLIDLRNAEAYKALQGVEMKRRRERWKPNPSLVPPKYPKSK